MSKATRHELQARRTHPLVLLFSLVVTFKDFLLPVILLFILNIGSQSMLVNLGKVAIILYLIYTVVSAFLGWWRYKYELTDKEFRIYEGRFVRERRFIPLDRIQNVQQDSLFFHRMFGVTSLTLNTAASGDDSSVKLDVITREEADRIQKHLNLAGPVHSEGDESVKESETEHSSCTVHYQMEMKQIIAASLTSFSLFALIPVLIWLYSKADRVFSVEDYIDPAIAFFGHSWEWLMVAIALILLSSILLSIAKNYVQYGNFQVASDEKRIYIERGVFNHSEFSIAKDKVQAIQLEKSFLRRWFGFAEVKLVSSGGSEEIETFQTLFPFISEKKGIQLLNDILPYYEMESSMSNLPRAAFHVKMLRPSYMWIIATVAVLYFWPNLWYVSPALLVLIIIFRILDYYNSLYVQKGPYIQFQSGSFSTETFLTTRKRIEELEVKESWLQRKFGLATLEISARANPVHVSMIEDIPKSLAIKYYHWYADR